LKDQFIGLMVEDKPALVVGLLAILKSGNAFVPVNPIFPDERIHFILNDCNIDILVTDDVHYSRALQIARQSPVLRHLLCIDGITGELTARHGFEGRGLAVEIAARETAPDVSAAPCYVIYTSGSTGRPKGVPITHQNLVPLLLWFGGYFRLGGQTKIFHNLSYTFDFGVFEILTTVMFGGSMYMSNKEEAGDFAFYADFIEAYGINTIHTTPAFFAGIVSAGKKMSSLDIVHLGGENFTGALAARIRELTPERCRIYNGYGPTEATINCSIYQVLAGRKRDFSESESITIGRPSAWNRIYILDRFHQLQPVGVSGELCVAGIGLAEGYLNSPELTAEKFDQDLWDYQDYHDKNQKFLRGGPGGGAVFSKSAPPGCRRLYKTGDLARWLLCGNIEFLGRIDQQVKIRGYRIELGEIENRLLKNSAIKEAVVLARQDEGRDQRYLCAYITLREGFAGENVTVSELREYLAGQLPDYMIPAYFIRLEKIPLTANGKIDRRALPRPTLDTIMAGAEYAAPVGETEQRMAGIWQEILGIDRIGREDDFFESGGDSILATRCIARLREEFQVDISLRKIFECPSIKALSKEVAAAAAHRQGALAIKKAPRDGHIPLSFPQERLWFLQELDAGSVAYFVPRVIRMKGKLQAALIERTFTEIIRRHEIMRTVFANVDGQPVQQIRSPYPFKIPVMDWSGFEKEEQEQRVSAFLNDEGRRSFDFENGPLLRVTLLKLKEEEHLFVLTEHHLIHDGWTQGVLLREFITLFTAFFEGRPSPLPELSIQYGDYAYWQRNYLKGQVLERKLDYWKEKLAGLEPLVNLPLDRPRPSVISGRGAEKRLVLCRELSEALLEFGKERDATLFMTMLAVFKVLLSRYTGIEDLCVGTGIANRQYKETEGMLGMIINTLALRTRIPAELSFEECLQRVKATCLEALEYQDTPFEKVVEIMQPERSLSYNPIFQVVYGFMDTPTERLHLPGLELIAEPAHNRSAKFDINVIVTPPMAQHPEETGDGIEIAWEYNTDIFDDSTMDHMLSHYNRLLQEVVIHPDLVISALPMMDKSEINQLLVEWNRTDTKYPAGKSIHRLFEEQVEKSPDSVAVSGGAHEFHKLHGFNKRKSQIHITYCELNRKANRLAHVLTVKGILPDTIVGIIMERSIDMIVGILAILKAGGAYLPIEPGEPGDRMLAMLEDCDVSILLTESNAVENRSFAMLQGLRANDTLVQVTGPRAQVMNFDDLPIPDRSMVNYEKYTRYIGQGMVKNSITMQATRGCPYNCAYCCRVWPRKFVTRSADNIFAEVQLYYNMGIRRFVFIDDIFNLDIRGSGKFFQMILDNGLKVKMLFPSGLRGDILTREYIDLMVRAGVISFPLALETASPRLQKLIGKNLNIEKLRENLLYIIENHPHVILELCTMHGFPTETEEEAMMTLDFVKSLKWIHFPYIHILKIHPDTRMKRLAIESGISEEAISRSENLAYHKLPETLPFEKKFTLKYQSDFLNNYFLSKHRLLHVLPYQMQILTEDEIVQKYNSYLPVDIHSLEDLLRFLEITREQLGSDNCVDEEKLRVHGLNRRIKAHFPREQPAAGALRVLLLDLSQLFSQQDRELYDVKEQPLGLMYLMAYLKQQFGETISGKIAKSRIDFDGYAELKVLLEEFQPDVIGMRTLTIYNDFFHKTAAMIRHWGIRCPIIAGGPYATSGFKTLLQNRNIDLAVLGEGEITLAELIGKIMENGKRLPGEEVLKGIHGIAFIPAAAAGQKKSAREIIMLDQWAGVSADQSRENTPTVSQAADLAYVIYTSGSTGKPKGNLTQHYNVTRVVRNTNYIDIKKDDRLLQLSNYAFDGSVFDIYGALLNGSALVMPRQEEVLELDRLAHLIKKEQVTVFFVTTALFNILVDLEIDFLYNIRKVLFGGEQVSVGHTKKAREYAGKNRIIHVYGPTETTVYATYYFIGGVDESVGTIPIGKPISNTAVYILDKNLHPVPIGVNGEIYIGGDGVARGYVNYPELTAEKFIVHKLHEERKLHLTPNTKHLTLYKTGDLARWLNDGNIEFLGRMDHQVKIRGFRIELGEIESRLSNYGGIKESVVLVREEVKGDKYLCAYIVSDNELVMSELREYLSKELPDYMIPSYFVSIEKLPLTSNGKIDRKALPKPVFGNLKEYEAFRDESEKKLVEIWSEVLNMDKERINMEANFFEVGGNSLKATLLMAKIHKALNIKVPLEQFFKTPRIRGLAELIRGLEENRFSSIEPVEKKEYYILTSAQTKMYILQQMDLKSVAYNLPAVIAFSEGNDIEKLEESFRQLIERHDSFRTSFHMLQDEPVQIVHDLVEFKIEYYDISTAKNDEVKEIINNFVHPFDFAQAPLLRVGLLEKEKKRHFLLVDLHHIISDGVSEEILIKDFIALYRNQDLRRLRIQYTDFAEWQTSKRVKKNLKKQEQYWLDQFSGEIPVMDIPSDYMRPEYHEFKGSRIEFDISKEKTGQLKKLAKEENLTMFMVMFAFFNVLLSKLSLQEDIVVGTDVAGRKHADLEQIVGCFVNSLPIRSFPRSEKRFIDFLAEVRDKTIKAFENQGYPFEDLVGKKVGKRVPNRNPLFDVMFSYHTNEVNQGNRPKVPLDYEYEIETAKFDLLFSVNDSGMKMNCVFEYKTSLFKEDRIKKYIKFFEEILVSLLDDKTTKLKDIRVTSDLLDAETDNVSIDFGF
jgi:amino acid adenylation domain-containing protein